MLGVSTRKDLKKAHNNRSLGPTHALDLINLCRVPTRLASACKDELYVCLRYDNRYNSDANGNNNTSVFSLPPLAILILGGVGSEGLKKELKRINWRENRHRRPAM